MPTPVRMCRSGAASAPRRRAVKIGMPPIIGRVNEQRPGAWADRQDEALDTEDIWKQLVKAATAPSTIDSDRTRRALLSQAMTVGSTITGDSLGCSITESVGNGYRTPVASNSIALDLDSAQYADDDGPCIVACRDGSVQSITVMADERDYREFVHVALNHGVRSSLSLPLPTAHRPSALNLYASSTSAFDESRSRAVAHLLARCAAAVLTADPFAAVRQDPSGATGAPVTVTSRPIPPGARTPSSSRRRCACSPSGRVSISGQPSPSCGGGRRRCNSALPPPRRTS